MANQPGEAVKERVKVEKQDPILYKVVLLNDDYTTMEFVVQVLEGLFQKSPSEAYRIMMHVHVNGRGINLLGWITTASIFAATIGLVITWFR